MSGKLVPYPETAASKVFAMPEVLGSILGHLDPVEIAHVQLAHPHCLDVVKNFPHLRRQFFLEQDPRATDGGFQLNPIFEMVFRIFGWSMGPTEVVRRYPEEAILRYRPSLLHLCPDWKDEFRCSIRQSYKRVLLDENAWRFVLDLRPLLQQTLFAKASHPVSIFPICDRDRDLVPYGYVDVVEGWYTKPQCHVMRIMTDI
ncbi:hypothetical protein CKM354_000010800 [Cercospora kikuchii]|uniref:F-box domain-containing protein n=1 Tax=Cercospora kikuchii TaxID=84275 RepID=A0A9P3C5D3_9PEZI|nr:uncharacterized protein CKM354_000010800 [Cercospora kikuchii]GIZ36638.1 hypothetical protein CKM354_000010800 [Cercospora kikuchii]